MIPPDTETRAFALRLRPGTAAEYQRRHDAIWPEMAQVLKDAGIIHYEIHLSRADHLLFACILRRRDHTMADILIATDGQVRVPLAQMFTLG